MIRASVSYAKSHLSTLLRQVKAGESVVITNRRRPVARLVPARAVSWGEDLEEMARLGLIRLPTGPTLTLREIQANRVDTGGESGVLRALLEDRREGR